MLQEFYLPNVYERSESLGWLLKRLQQSLVGYAERQLCREGLTHAQWGPLLMLSVNGPSSVAKLVEQLGTDAGAMTRLLDRLEAKGLCARERSSEDRRVVMLSLTEEGKRITQDLTAVLADDFNAHLEGFTHDEWRQLISFLQRMLATGERLRGADSPPADASPQESSAD
ncbi:MarR family transcriptional regulator [Paucibacter sp. R3-3]|uniref:MarR family transcriptional regulator n=1 Tax=Roseateles agri TaxID=3098619 RepID=A0ABU5DKE8_9BURK|nr:MarR family transcriptional regulator [Paucibacter sp. R3-3]MDY0746236.1 MarR family transcriptional regulator [Paucibacter sp. R3-3]